jgi:TBC1 domain family member 14
VQHPKLIEALADCVATSVDCGWNHVALVADSGDVYTWGCTLNGKLGHGRVNNTPDRYDVASPRLVEGLSDALVVDISCGYHHTIALDVDGVIYSWGKNDHGQLGIGNTDQHFSPIRVASLNWEPITSQDDDMSSATAATDAASLGRSPPQSPTNKPPSDRAHPDATRITSITSGSFHCMAINATGDLFSWGWNAHGQLGTCDSVDRYVPTWVSSLAGLDAVSISCGGTFSICITSRLFAVQNNYFDQHQHQRAEAAAAAAAAAADIIAGTSVRSDMKQSNDTSPSKASAHSSGSAHVSPNSKSATSSGVVSSPVGSPRSRGPNPPLVKVRQLTQPRLSTKSKSSDSSKLDAAGTLSDSSSSNDAGAASAETHALENSSSTTSNAAGSSSSDSSKRSGTSRRSSILDSILRVFRRNSHPDRDKASADSATGAPNRPVSRSSSRASGATPKKSGGKQRDEMNRMNEMYRRKLLREARNKEKRRKNDQKRQETERRMMEEKQKRDQEREVKLEEASREWLAHIIPNWEYRKYQAKAKDVVWKVGVPPQIRNQVWPLVLGNEARVTEELYEIFGSHARNAREVKRNMEKQQLEAANAANANAVAAAAAGTDSKDSSNTPAQPLLEPSAAGAAQAISAFGIGKEATFSYIDVDLTRTFPSLAFFSQDCHMNEELRHILETFCFYRPDIGYVQGMSYIAGNLLLYMDPLTAFTCFANLLRSSFFHAFLKLDRAMMQERYSILDALFRDHLPKLHRHFDEENIIPDLYFLEWCMTLYCKRLKLDVVGRIWDCYFIFGEAFIYRTAVGILKILQPRLLGEPFDVCMRRLRNDPKNLTEGELFKAIAPIKLTQEQTAKLSQLQKLRIRKA